MVLKESDRGAIKSDESSWHAHTPAIRNKGSEGFACIVDHHTDDAYRGVFHGDDDDDRGDCGGDGGYCVDCDDAASNTFRRRG